MARRSMAKNRSPQPSRSGKRADTEASAGSQTQIDSAFESAASGSSALGPDGQLIAPSSLKDSRDRLTSAKRRRRQANQVRSRQPFWAALASTKVTVMREYEHSRAMSKTTRGLPMTEDDLQGVTLDDGLIWITHVDSSSIKFAAGDFASADDPTTSGACEAGRAGGEYMEPFYVCVNGAHWATATICRVNEGPRNSNAVQWRGEISGLAPNCAYTCSFIRSDTDEEICVMSVKTPSTPDAEQGTNSLLFFFSVDREADDIHCSLLCRISPITTVLSAILSDNHPQELDYQCRDQVKREASPLEEGQERAQACCF